MSTGGGPPLGKKWQVLHSSGPCSDCQIPMGPRASHNMHNPLLRHYSWRRGSAVRTSVFSWRTFPDLHLMYGWHVTTSWVEYIRYGSTNQANSAFHPFGVGKWVVIHVITWITRVETIRSGLHAAVWPQGQSPVCAGLVYARSVCDAKRSCSLQFVALCKWWAFSQLSQLSVCVTALLLSFLPLHRTSQQRWNQFLYPESRYELWIRFSVVISVFCEFILFSLVLFISFFKNSD